MPGPCCRLATLAALMLAAAAPRPAAAFEVALSGAVDRAALGSTHVRLVVEESGGAWVRDAEKRTAGTYRLSGLQCGKTVRHFEVWTPRATRPKQMTVSTSFTLEGPSVRALSATLVRHVTGSSLRDWHHGYADFDLVVTLDCSQAPR